MISSDWLTVTKLLLEYIFNDSFLTYFFQSIIHTRTLLMINDV